MRSEAKNMILIVDDKEENLELLQAVVESSGHKTVLARNGLEALGQLKKVPIDLIISDILMSKMDGFQLCRKCKEDEKFWKIPFILFTATYTDKQDEEFALSLGADRVIIKPIEQKELLKIIEEVLKEGKRGAVSIAKKTAEEETVYLKVYSERLIQKLEDKNEQLQKGLSESKRAEEALVKNENRYRTLFESSHDAIMTLEPPSWRFTSGNLAMVKMFMAKDEAFFTSHDPWSLSPERQPDGRASADKAMEMIEMAVRDGYNFFEWTHKRLNGEEFLATVQLTRVVLVEKTILQATIDDITERKKAEEALKESEGRFRAIFDHANDGILLADVEAKKFYIGNNTACQMLGYSLEEIKNLGITDIHPKEDLPYVFEQFERQVRKEIAVARDLPVKRKDGSVFYADVNTSSVILAGKTYLLGLFRDVTERKKVEAMIVHAKKEWEDTFDSISDIVTIHDLDFNILRANKATESMFGLTFKELTATKCYKVYHKGNCLSEGCPSRNTLKTGKVSTGEIYESSLGIYFEIKTFPRFDEKNNLVGIVHIARDITQRKKIEADIGKAKEDLEKQARVLDEQLKEAIKSREIVASMLEDNNKIREKLEQHIEELKRAQNMLIQSEKLASIGKLVADMAHEVNNPLMIISGNAQLSLLDASLSKELKNNLKIIHEECNRAKNIIHRLLMFSRPSKGEQKPLDINQNIESVVKLLEHQFSLSNVKINLQLNTGLPLITADEKMIQEVIMNLLNNARDAMPEGGEITINTSLDAEYFKIETKDSGVGMDDKTLSRLFEPFFTTKEKGTGLGLSVCYGIIKTHKGKIEFESQPQKGTTAYIWLPIKKEVHNEEDSGRGR